MKTYSSAPYYDDYNEEKDYVQILAAAGNYAQSREFTQVGTLFRDYMERLGNSIYTNGQILSGCDIVVTGNKVTMAPGTLYLNGLVRKIRKELAVDINGVGEEVIGVKIRESIVTAKEDVSLRNPAVGTEGYNLEGASRVRQVVELTVNDTDAASLYKLVDGAVYTESIVTSTVENTQSVVTDVLARRTYDMSGNFKVEGLVITNKQTDDGTSQVYVSAGRAYIHGYEVVLPNMVSVPCEIPTTFRECFNEPDTYNEPSDKFYFNNNPLKSVKHVTTQVRVQVELTRGSISGGRDEIMVEGSTSIYRIEKVEYGTKVYEQGVDYQQVGNYIDWGFYGEEPSSGVTYQATVIYYRENIVNEDYVVLGSGDECYIQMLDSGRLPVPGSVITVDYDFYLSRVDTLIIDKNANITVLKGNPDRADYAEAPLNGDKTQLVLGTVLNYANSTKKTVANQHTTRLTQSDIYNLKKRIDDMEYNQAVNDLDREAKEGEDASELKGILTDGFIGFTKCDLGHSEFNCSIDVDMQEMTVPFTQEVVSLAIDQDSADSNIATIGRVITAPYTEKVCLAQSKATTRFLVNPYAVYGKLSICGLKPSVDNWIDSEVITVNGGMTTGTITLRRWWESRGASWAEEEKQKWLQLTGTTGEQVGTKAYSGVSTSVVSSVKSEAIAYMRERTVEVTGTNFEPYEDNIEVYFNGNRVPLLTKSTEGASTDTVKANNLGRFTCSFTVPKNTPCGSVEVKLVGPISTASAVYQAEGTKKTTTNKVLTTRVVMYAKDPLAETFQFEKDTVLVGMDLYFAAKDLTRSCSLQIRSVENGYPGTLVYAEETINPEDITVNGDRPVATHIRFSQPVYCEQNTQYCFVVLSDSNVYQIWTAEMGETDVVSKQPVTTQPYIDGVMFSSSNGLSWTAHQMADITFALYQAEYNGKGVIVFKNVSQVDFDRILLAAEVEDHKNAGIEWWYKINNEGSWNSIETYVDRDTTDIGRTIDLKANINVAQSTSPMIAGDCMNLVYFKNQTKGVYVSRQIEMDEAFNSIKVSAEFTNTAKCPGTTYKVYYMLPDVSKDWVELTDPTITQVDVDFNKHVYTKDGLNAKCYRVKIELTTVNPLVRPRCRKLMNILKY